MKAFWYFKSAVNAFMKVFIMLIPIISLVGAVCECWECVKYESAEFIDIEDSKYLIKNSERYD